ncbi:MAG: hypothetical protein ABW185_05435, partial [Sedimenticola sp.]
YTVGATLVAMNVAPNPYFVPDSFATEVAPTSKPGEIIPKYVPFEPAPCRINLSYNKSPTVCSILS